MHNNGVTHNTVCDDFEGVFNLLLWLSYMPKVRMICIKSMSYCMAKFVLCQRKINALLYFSLKIAQCPSLMPKIPSIDWWSLYPRRLPMTLAGCWQGARIRVSVLRWTIVHVLSKMKVHTFRIYPECGFAHLLSNPPLQLCAGNDFDADCTNLQLHFCGTQMQFKDHENSREIARELHVA